MVVRARHAVVWYPDTEIWECNCGAKFERDDQAKMHYDDTHFGVQSRVQGTAEEAS